MSHSPKPNFWKDNRFLVILLLIIFAIKLPFVFHGRWDAKFFVPYMTDETVVLGPMYSYIVSGNLDLAGLGRYYIPYLFNLLFPYFYFLFKILHLFTDKINPITVYEIIYYHSRIFVLICATMGAFFYVKLFKDIIRSRFYQAILLIFISLNSLFFLYSLYIKTDLIVWAFGAISMYYGFVFWKERTHTSYIKFYILSLLPVCFNYYGYIYFLNFILVSFIARPTPFIKNQTKLILIFVLSPLFWVTMNFEIILNLRLFVANLKQYLFAFLISSATKGLSGNPFLEGISEYSSFQFYLDYLKYHLAPPLFIFLAMSIFFCKCRNTYYRIIGSVFVIFFIHISLCTLRTDRLFLPIFIFAIFLVVYFFYFCHELIKKTKFKWLVLTLTIIFTVSVLGETIKLARSLHGEDTRYSLYKYFQKNLPEKSKIFFLHLTIAGAYSTAQRIGVENWKDFDLKIVPLPEKEKAVESLSLIKGYFVLSAIDLDILKDGKETKYYSEQYKALEELLARSSLVTCIDKINYAGQPFGPTWMIPNSLYGIHNPPLFVYKTVDYDVFKR